MADPRLPLLSDQMKAALLRSAYNGLLAGATAAVTALLTGASLQHAALLGAAALLAVLGGRGVVEGVIDTGRAQRGELLERRTLPGS